jgi:NAD-dependent DNA ligase
MTQLDPHGQPLNPALNHARRRERDLSEMLGLAKGMLVDGVVTDTEARFLHDWGLRHQEAIGQWPLNLVFTRLHQHFVDGAIDEIERRELHNLLEQLIGGTASILLGFDGATTLPLDEPPPLVCYGPDEVFVFTGRFAYGPRKVCEQEVSARGSRCEPDVTRRTSFLVIGTFGSRDWIHSSYGRKIQRAVQLRDCGFALRIVGEDHWANSIGTASGAEVF